MTTTDTAPILDMDKPSIYVLMGEALAELPAIGKDSYNPQQKFAFRGIDDVLVALNPVLSHKGIFIMPTVLERTEGTRTTNSGGTMYVVNLKVQFDFYGPRGDHVSAVGQGEGTDMGDKATPKAMTGAFKYVLFQAFAIATKEAAEADSDHGSPPDTAPSVACAQCKEATGEEVMFPAPSVDPVPIREHYVTVHGYVRDPETGKVSPPPAPVTPDAAEPTTDATPEPPSDPQPAPDDTPAPTPPAADPVPDMDDVTPPGFDEKEWERIVAYTSALKVSALADQCEKLGLPKGGTKQVMIDRLLDHYRGNNEDAVDPAASRATDPEPTPDPTPAAEEEAAAEPDPEKFPFRCPDCDVFPFRTEEDYTEHWYEAHGDGDDEEESESAEDVPSTTDTQLVDDEPAPETMVEALKTALGGLRNQSARAYAEYRRTSGLPTKPADMTVAQVSLALDFIDQLPD